MGYEGNGSGFDAFFFVGELVFCLFGSCCRVRVVSFELMLIVVLLLFLLWGFFLLG